jgi:hypothetical protein
MSESKEKTPRSIGEIQAEYQSLCTRAGDLQYKVFIFSKDLELVNASLKDLNFEAAAAHSRDVKEKAKADEEAKAKEAGITEAPKSAPKLSVVEDAQIVS